MAGKGPNRICWQQRSRSACVFVLPHQDLRDLFAEPTDTVEYLNKPVRLIILSRQRTHADLSVCCPGVNLRDCFSRWRSNTLLLIRQRQKKCFVNFSDNRQFSEMVLFYRCIANDFRYFVMSVYNL